MDENLVSHFTPPILPPKNHHDSNGLMFESASIAGSNTTANSLIRPHDTTSSQDTVLQSTQSFRRQVEAVPVSDDPGDEWLPSFLEGLPKHETVVLADPKLLDSLAHSPRTIHPATLASIQTLSANLVENAEIASHLSELEKKVVRQRSALQAQLISTHALERQWRQKQTSMDHALVSFSPASLYQRLAQSVQEQASVCQAIEESFLSGRGDDGGSATERETLDWVQRYMEAKSSLYLRQERKDRWDEGRVGGWR